MIILLVRGTAILRMILAAPETNRTWDCREHTLV
jgi:hypothetical protein